MADHGAPSSPMGPLIRILTIQSVEELFKYRTFFVLIFGLLFIDQLIQHVSPDDSALAWEQGALVSVEKTAGFVFGELPGQLERWLGRSVTWVVLGGLFLLKQVVSLWPTSDMRRMHRKERDGFGIVSSLLAIRWHQVLFDACAVGLNALVAGVVLTAAFLVGFGCWRFGHDAAGLAVLAAALVFMAPLTLAGFSYSSKIAVLKTCGFTRRLELLFLLFTNRRIFRASWIFFALRFAIELVFVAVIPLGSLMLIPNFFARIAIAAIFAVPAYAYVKMASFKFFLEVYKPFPVVRKEYAAYYTR